MGCPSGEVRSRPSAICEIYLLRAGTGYYFSRYRPGVGVRINSLSPNACTHRACPQTVLIFLALLTSLLQNVVHRLNHKREVERVQKFMLLARKAAWGPKLVKNDAPRKVRVNIAGNPYIDGEEQEYVQGRMIDMLVQGNEVYLVSTSLPKPPCPCAAHPTATDQVAGHRDHFKGAC